MFEGQPKGFPFGEFDLADVMLPEGDDMGIPSDSDDGKEEEEVQHESGFGNVLGARLRAGHAAAAAPLAAIGGGAAGATLRPPAAAATALWRRRSCDRRQGLVVEAEELWPWLQAQRQRRAGGTYSGGAASRGRRCGGHAAFAEPACRRTGREAAGHAPHQPRCVAGCSRLLTPSRPSPPHLPRSVVSPALCPALPRRSGGQPAAGGPRKVRQADRHPAQDLQRHRPHPRRRPAASRGRGHSDVQGVSQPAAAWASWRRRSSRCSGRGCWVAAEAGGVGGRSRRPAPSAPLLAPAHRTPPALPRPALLPAQLCVCRVRERGAGARGCCGPAGLPAGQGTQVCRHAL